MSVQQYDDDDPRLAAWDKTQSLRAPEGGFFQAMTAAIFAVFCAALAAISLILF